jgi:Domain of unknown function (DUF1772)
MNATAQMIRKPLRAATLAAVGMLAGAMLLIKLVLVPFWQGVPPREFRTWFGRHSRQIRALMVPLGAAGVGTAVVTTAVEATTDGAPGSAVVAAGASAGVVAVTMRVNEPANEKFEQIDFDDAETAALLERWARWHDLRVGLGLLATAAAAKTAASQRSA